MIVLYEELVRIPDYVAGTLADYNFEENEISKSKFEKILQNFMAENDKNNFVFKIDFSSDINPKCSSITFHSDR